MRCEKDEYSITQMNRLTNLYNFANKLGGASKDESINPGTQSHFKIVVEVVVTGPKVRKCQQL